MLLDEISKRLDHKIDFKVYYEQKSGTDLQAFMRERILDSEAVLALFSPDYKYKVDNRVNSGVFTEFLTIVDRLEMQQDSFLFIPVFWAGPSFESATPDFFMNRNFARSLQKFKAYGAAGKSAYLPQRLRAEVEPEIDRIVSDLTLRWYESDPEYAKLKREIDDTLLPPTTFAPEPEAETFQSRKDVERAMFRKSERAPMTLQEFNDRFFVQTAAFRAIGSNHRMAFTGRKGSGKTTLLKIYKYQNSDRYFDPIDVEVNDWNLHYLLGELVFKPTESDLRYTEEESRVFDFIWPVFLSLCLVKSLLASNSSLSANELLPKMTHARRFSKCNDRYELLFALAIELVKEFIQNSIDHSPTESEGEFRIELLGRLNVRACTEFVLGKGYAKILGVAHNDERKRRFLFCLDRFDTEIQKYRKDLKDHNYSDEERGRRETREVFWIQGLVELIDYLRSPDRFSPNHEFYQKIGPLVDFCVPLPKDRLYEVQLRRRDSTVSEINEEINWQPYELLTMLRRRLQSIWQVSNDQLDKPSWPRARQRYERVLELSLRRIPKTVDISINGKRFPSDLFLDVLRHTFFRPRDVIIYYARIVLAVEAAHRRGQRLSSGAVARLISEQTYKIVEDEFLGEFLDTFKNVREVLHRFRGSTQLLSFDELSEKLDDCVFKIYGEEGISSLGERIRFLYEIGFIGVCSSAGHLGNVPINDYDFYFINPRIAEALEQTNVLQSLKFAIHPVFIEYLTLKLNSPSPVLMLSWQRVDELDAFD
jgi:hypothetical protein